MNYTVLAVGGTTESYPGDTRTEPQGMLSFVTKALDPTRFQSRWVGYPSDFGYPMAEVDSIAAGVANLDAVIESVTGPVVLLGYSQGAQVVRTCLGKLAVEQSHIRAVGLIADPWRPLGVQEGPALTGYGIAGAVADWPKALPVYEIAAADDMIGNTDARSPLRPVADVLKFFDVTDPVMWMRDVLAMAAEDGWQVADIKASADEMVAAVNDLIGYAIEGHHTQYAAAMFPGETHTYCEHLAGLITTLESAVV